MKVLFFFFAVWGNTVRHGEGSMVAGALLSRPGSVVQKERSEDGRSAHSLSSRFTQPSAPVYGMVATNMQSRPSLLT